MTTRPVSCSQPSVVSDGPGPSGCPLLGRDRSEFILKLNVTCQIFRPWVLAPNDAYCCDGSHICRWAVGSLGRPANHSLRAGNSVSYRRSAVPLHVKEKFWSQ